MATIKEDYVSYEVAKLLKEKGFDEPTWTYYEDDDEVIFSNKYNWNNSPMGQISAPTHQMVMKWLRKKYRLYISINIEVGDVQMLPSYDFEETLLGYSYAIYNEETLIWVFKDKTPRSYEKAVEAAIKYCLENLV